MPVKSEYDDSYLKRLDPEFYRGQAYVHWSLTIHDRKQGWLKPIMLYKFRELLTHTMFRYGVCCPIFVLMPDHFHMMWIGILEESDQRPAMKHFRTRLNETLAVLDCKLQAQPYEDVLKEDERQEHAFYEICNYIARNPERAGLVEIDKYADYKYSGCIVPGYPEMKLFNRDSWPRFWRAYSYLNKNGLMRLDEK
jgi:REP element-mobilizing transposase RayT